MDESSISIQEILDRLCRIESAIDILVSRQTIKDWYSPEELAQLLNKAEFTVREWCRLGRIRAEKKGSGRGKFMAWVVSHDEVLRIPYPQDPTRISKKQIFKWSDEHFQRTGRLPQANSGPNLSAPETTWSAVNDALRYGPEACLGRSASGR